MEKMDKVKTKVVHSKTKTAWNVIGVTLGGKYKIARCPYLSVDDNEILATKYKHEALEHAQFISNAFNAAFHNDCESVVIMDNGESIIGQHIRNHPELLEDNK